jgi:hypothetical protein
LALNGDAVSQASVQHCPIKDYQVRQDSPAMLLVRVVVPLILDRPIFVCCVGNDPALNLHIPLSS